MPMRHLPLDALTIRGERAFRSIACYPALKRLLREDGFTFRVPDADSGHAHADRVLFLNLTFWNAGDSSDVLLDGSIDADVVAHAAWHHAARKALGGSGTAAALFLGESVASAFDLYVIGHMLRDGKKTAYLSTQVPAISAAAQGAGVAEEDLAELLASVAVDPDAAFADLRALLYDASLALYASPDIDGAVAALDTFAEHRFYGLLHHFALSTWVLYTRAYAAPARPDDPAVITERALRDADSPVDWLTANWLGGTPAVR